MALDKQELFSEKEMSDVEDPNLPFSFALLCVPPPPFLSIVRSFAAVDTDTFSSSCVLIVRIKNGVFL